VEKHSQCVVYGEVITNNSFNTKNLHKHLTKNQESLANKPSKFFERKLLDIYNKSNLKRTAVTTSIKAL
jgi:hypothetical protein